MGISMSCDMSADVPRDLTVSLICDGVCFNQAAFTCGYVEAHGAAMRAGWLERQAPSGRLWLCPACSGKPVQ